MIGLKSTFLEWVNGSSVRWPCILCPDTGSPDTSFPRWPFSIWLVSMGTKFSNDGDSGSRPISDMADLITEMSLSRFGLKVVQEDGSGGFDSPPGCPIPTSITRCTIVPNWAAVKLFF